MQNKFVPAVLIGGVIGGVVVLADKNTRQSLSTQIKNFKEGKSSNQPSKVNQIKDEVLYWKEVVEEIRRKNPELEQQLKDAKNIFVEKKNNRKLSGPTNS